MFISNIQRRTKIVWFMLSITSSWKPIYAYILLLCSSSICDDFKCKRIECNIWFCKSSPFLIHCFSLHVKSFASHSILGEIENRNPNQTFLLSHIQQWKILYLFCFYQIWIFSRINAKKMFILKPKNKIGFCFYLLILFSGLVFVCFHFISFF